MNAQEPKRERKPGFHEVGGLLGAISGKRQAANSTKGQKEEQQQGANFSLFFSELYHKNKADPAGTELGR